MKIVIINGSARKGNTLTAIYMFIKGALDKNQIEVIQPDNFKLHLVRAVESVNVIKAV